MFNYIEHQRKHQRNIVHAVTALSFQTNNEFNFWCGKLNTSRAELLREALHIYMSKLAREYMGLDPILNKQQIELNTILNINKSLESKIKKYKVLNFQKCQVLKEFGKTIQPMIDCRKKEIRRQKCQKN
jgi:hypothetical protein